MDDRRQKVLVTLDCQKVPKFGKNFNFRKFVLGFRNDTNHKGSILEAYWDFLLFSVFFGYGSPWIRLRNLALLDPVPRQGHGS
jgi:hypothetical protein